MKSLEIIIIAVALAMDAFAVSIACGLCKKQVSIVETLKVGLFFGGFQAIMPLIGYYAGLYIPVDFSKFDHWIAFLLLAFIGAHMIKESFEEDEECKPDMFGTKTLLIAAIATSIDALAAGFSIALLEANICLLVITTGIVTFAAGVVGVKIGKRFGHLLESRVELFSGIVLIAIGAKILIEHLLT